MMELVRLAEYAEGKAKEDIAALLSKRSTMLEALTAMSAYRLPTLLHIMLLHYMFSIVHIPQLCVACLAAVMRLWIDSRHRA